MDTYQQNLEQRSLGRRSLSSCVLRGMGLWVSAFIGCAIVFALSGLRPDLEWLLAAMGGPATLVSVYAVNLESAWVVGLLSMVAFVAFQRSTFAWVWCVVWIGVGLGFVLWAAHKISIT
jgi:hypothetical protein